VVLRRNHVFLQGNDVSSRSAARLSARDTSLVQLGNALSPRKDVTRRLTDALYRRKDTVARWGGALAPPEDAGLRLHAAVLKRKDVLFQENGVMRRLAGALDPRTSTLARLANTL
jgi:hypothetical protein